MKTGNILSIAALIICGMVCVNSVNAQVPTTTDQVTVNIKFKSILSIEVNPTQKTVDLEYYTPENYINGVSNTQDDHLTVFSTGGGFEVRVNSNGDFTRSAGGTIPASDMKIQAADGTGGKGTSFPNVTLSSTEQLLISGGSSGTASKYNVTYDNSVAGGNNEYTNKYVVDDSESVYTAEVTYTITAP